MIQDFLHHYRNPERASKTEMAIQHRSHNHSKSNITRKTQMAIQHRSHSNINPNLKSDSISFAKAHQPQKNIKKKKGKKKKWFQIFAPLPLPQLQQKIKIWKSDSTSFTPPLQPQQNIKNWSGASTFFAPPLQPQQNIKNWNSDSTSFAQPLQPKQNIKNWKKTPKNKKKKRFLFHFTFDVRKWNTYPRFVWPFVSFAKPPGSISESRNGPGASLYGRQAVTWTTRLPSIQY